MSEERKGLSCPRCGERMARYYGRNGNGYVMRRRKCVGCDYAETTEERPIGMRRQPDSSHKGTTFIECK